MAIVVGTALHQEPQDPLHQARVYQAARQPGQHQILG